MACRWRIRHKLMAGLGLVVAILALLLGGTIKGLASYRAAMKTMESKLVELNEANAFQQEVNLLKGISESTPDAKKDRAAAREKIETDFVDQIKKSHLALVNYQQKLQQTIALDRDPSHGYLETSQVAGLEASFTRLKRAWENASIGVKVDTGGSDSLVLSNADVKGCIDELVRSAGDLINVINENLYRRIKKGGDDYKLCLAVVLSTSVIGVLLMASLLRFFYRWVFYPIRDLQQGAGRVAQGDFDHRIDVKSGDEMEDLATAFNDMTGRLREIYRDLARQVNERSRQLVRSERLAGVGFLAAGVAHEINNPLASIAFCSEALERRLDEVLAAQARSGRPVGGDRETITKYLKMIQEESFRCKEITQRLLEFSRGGERRREPTDLAELIQGVLDMVRHLQNCRGKNLVFNPPGPLVAAVNGQEVKSVVLNLVVNALDSMDDGGTLQIGLRQRDGMAELVFADTGCGMSAEILENIFEPFFTRSRTGKGTGLGLSISHRIINNHGGEIEAASPGPNQGSTFTVRLPLQPAEPAAPPTTENAIPVFPAQAVDYFSEAKRGRTAA